MSSSAPPVVVPGWEWDEGRGRWRHSGGATMVAIEGTGHFGVRFGSTSIAGVPRSATPGDVAFWACSAAMYCYAMSSITRGAVPGPLPGIDGYPTTLPDDLLSLGRGRG